MENKEYGSFGHRHPEKFIINPDRTVMSYDKISSPEPHLMNIFITERWIDEEKNVWYRVENVYPAYFTYQDLWKLDSSENTLEAMLFGFEYPDDLNTTDGNYRIWHRAQEAL